MEFAKMKGPVLKYGGIVGIVLGILNAIGTFASIIPFIGPILALLGVVILLPLSCLLAVIVGFLTAKAVGIKDIATGAVGGGLAAVIMTIVAAVIQIIAYVIGAILELFLGIAIGTGVTNPLAIILGIGIYIAWDIIAIIGGLILGAIGGAIGSAVMK